jgi:hypothetical protein
MLGLEMGILEEKTQGLKGELLFITFSVCLERGNLRG